MLYFFRSLFLRNLKLKQNVAVICVLKTGMEFSSRLEWHGFPVVEPDQIRAKVRGNWSEKRARRHREMRRGTEMRWCRCGEMGKISILTVELKIVFDAKKKPHSAVFCSFWKNRFKSSRDGQALRITCSWLFFPC